MPNKSSPNGSLSDLIAARIRSARIASGLTQSQLSASLGVTYQQLQKYESGKNRVTFDRLHKIADVVGMPITYFLGNEPHLPPDVGIDVIALILEWSASNQEARRLLRSLPELSQADARVVADLVERFAQNRPPREQ